jgi:hypothetical protein
MVSYTKFNGPAANLPATILLYFTRHGFVHVHGKKISTQRHRDLSPDPSPQGRGERSGRTPYLLRVLRAEKKVTRRPQRRNFVPLNDESPCSPCLRVDNLFSMFMHKTMPREVYLLTTNYYLLTTD